MDGLVLSDDLLFISRIQGTARDHGLTCVSVRTPEQLLAKATAEPPRCVLLDLHLVGDFGGVVGPLKGLSPAPFLVGYGSHVDAETLHAARIAGCDLVLPRSKFVEDLPTELAVWFGAK
jgi:ActR/RegA family two-component response regulator